MSDQKVNSNAGGPRKKRRVLPPSEKYELWVSIVSGQSTQREAADKYKVDRSTVVGVCRTAKQGALDALAAAVPGRRGQSVEEVEIAPVDRMVDQGQQAGLHRRVNPRGDRAGRQSQRAFSLVQMQRHGLLGHRRPQPLDLILELRGWPRRRACLLLGVDEDRLGRWAVRRDTALSTARRVGADSGADSDAARARRSSKRWPTRPRAGIRCTGCCRPSTRRSWRSMTRGGRSTDRTASWPTAVPGWTWSTYRSPRSGVLVESPIVV